MNSSIRRYRLVYIFSLVFFSLCLKPGQCFNLNKTDTLFILINSLDSNKEVTPQTGYIFCIHGGFTPSNQSDSSSIRKNITLYPFPSSNGEYTYVVFNNNTSIKFIKICDSGNCGATMQTRENIVRLRIIKKRRSYFGFIPGPKRYYFILDYADNKLDRMICPLY